MVVDPLLLQIPSPKSNAPVRALRCTAAVGMLVKWCIQSRVCRLSRLSSFKKAVRKRVRGKPEPR